MDTPAFLTRQDAEALADLLAHWGSAYMIMLTAGRWTASFGGTGEPLTASSAGELRELMRRDYWQRKMTPRLATVR